MGGNNSNPFKEVLEDYKIVQHIQEFNITYLIHKQTNREYLLRTLTYNDERDFKKNMEVQQARKNLDKSQHLTMLSRVESGKEDNICSHFLKIYSLWEYPHRTLSEELDQRRTQKRKFQQKELWSILASTILGMSVLQRNNIRHQCLSTKTLLLSNQGLLKVADPITTQVISNFEALHNNRKLQQLYLSPEQCAQLSASNYLPSLSYKNDVYSMGMIMLECGLLKSQIQCYKDDCGRIDFEILHDNLNRFGMQYSDSIRGMIQYMLTRDSKQRPDWIQLQRHVRRVDSIQTNQRQQRKSEFSSIPRQTDYNQHMHQPTQRNSYSGMMAYVPRNGMQQVGYGNFTGQGYSSNIRNQYQERNQKFNIYENVNTARNKAVSREPKKGLSLQPNQQGDIKSVIRRKAINIGGKESQNKIKQSGTKNYTTQKGNQYTPSNIQNNINKDAFGVQNFKGNFAQTPYDIIRSPDYTQKSPFNVTHITQGGIYERSHYPENNFKHQIGNIYAPAGFNQILRNQEYSTGIKRNYQPSQQYNYTFKNQQYQNVRNYQRKPEQINPVSYQTNSYVSATMSSGNKPAYNFTSSDYNAAIYGIQGVTTTSSISAPPPIGSFDYGKSLNFANNNNQQKQDYKYNQNYQAFMAHQKASIEKKRQSHGNSVEKSSNRNRQSQEGFQIVIEHFKQGSRYQGSKLNGMRHGKGKFYYQDGGLYDGEWKSNKMHGYGALYYQSGKIAYEGDWCDDQFQGIGKLYNQNPQKLSEAFDYNNFDLIDEYWVYFDGQFVQDLKHGKGKLMLSNGQYLIGKFDRDMVQGQCKFYCKNGECINGYWQNNQLSTIF